MSTEEHAGMPAEPGADDVVVAYYDEGLLVGGDPTAVESYLTQLRTSAGRAVQVAEISGTSVGNIAGLLAGASSILGSRG